jgi:hypothetical protein
MACAPQRRRTSGGGPRWDFGVAGPHRGPNEPWHYYLTQDAGQRCIRLARMPTSGVATPCRHSSTPKTKTKAILIAKTSSSYPGAGHPCACYELGVTRSCPRASRRWGRNLCAWFPTSVELLPNSNRFRSLDTNQFCTVVLLIQVDWLWDLVCERGEIGDGLNIWPRECGVSAWQYWFLLFALGFHTLLFATNDILILLNIAIF